MDRSGCAFLRRVVIAVLVLAVLDGCAGASGSPPASATSPVAPPETGIPSTGSGASATTPAVPGSNQAVSPSPSGPASSVAPSPSGSTRTVAHSSTRFGYAIEYPAGWAVRTATADWPNVGFPEPDGSEVDRFGATADSASWMFVSSVVLVDGESAAGVPIKAKDMDDVRIAEMDTELPLVCQVSPKVSATIDGVDGHRQDLRQCFGKDDLIWVLVSNDIRLYLIGALAHGPIDDATRGGFDRFVGSFRFRS